MGFFFYDLVAFAAGLFEALDFGDAFFVELGALLVFELLLDLVPDLVAVEITGRVFVFELAVKAGLFEVGGHGTQDPSQASGFLVGEGAIGDTLGDLHESVMDGVGAVDEGEVDDGFGNGFRGGAAAGEVLGGAPVEVAEFVAAGGGRAALGSVDFDVSAAADVLVQHGFLCVAPTGLNVFGVI